MPSARSSPFPGWEVLGTSPSFEWGILITAYVFFAITTSGLCLASSLGTVFGIEMFLPLEKRHAVLALLTLITAFGIIALDLHYPVSMVFGAVLSPSPFSPMWWMGVFYGIYLVFLMVEVWSIFSNHWGIHRWACVCSSATAVIAPTTLGAVFAVLGARPYWHGAFTPPVMVTMAVLSGTALLGIVFYCVHRYRLAGHERALTLAIPAIRLLMSIGLVVAGLVIVWQILWGMYGVIPGLCRREPGDLRRAARALVLAGPGRPRAGRSRCSSSLIPRTRTPAGLFVTCCLVFLGIFADRAIFVSAGQIVPGTAVGGVVSSPYAEYVPSLVEAAIVMGAFGFFGLAYTLAERYLPMGEHTGHLAGGFLAGSHPAPAMVDAGVAWVAEEDEEVRTDGEPERPACRGAHAHAAAPAPAPSLASPAVDPPTPPRPSRRPRPGLDATAVRRTRPPSTAMPGRPPDRRRAPLMARRIGRLVLVLAAVGVVIGIGVGIGLAVINIGLEKQEAAVPSPTATPLATATPLPTPVASSGPGNLIAVMPTSDCAACHKTPGAAVNVPPIGHPLEGWGSCTSCHANDRLVKTAPGHSGIHAEQCLVCHTATTPAAEDRPHSLAANSKCLSCHGSLAPLPASMKGRSESTCFLCHQGTSQPAVAFPHPLPADGKCLTCHVAGKVGAVPADHATRTDKQCTACHLPSPDQPRVAPHDLKAYEGMCAFCHGKTGQTD